MLFYSNENFPLATVRALRQMGYDVLTTVDAGRANLAIPDEEVLDFAIEQGRAILTTNRKDFKKLHTIKSEHCGIILCTENNDFEELALKIHKCVSEHTSIDGLLLRVYKGN